MSTPPIKSVVASELRELFNRAGYPARIAAGEFRERILREGIPSPKNKQPPGTKSQTVGYFDAQGRLVIVVHRYLLKNGQLGGSGKPDPKRLLHEGTLYQAS